MKGLTGTETVIQAFWEAEIGYGVLGISICLSLISLKLECLT